jgi:hypothetical protein
MGGSITQKVDVIKGTDDITVAGKAYDDNNAKVIDGFNLVALAACGIMLS